MMREEWVHLLAYWVVGVIAFALLATAHGCGPSATDLIREDPCYTMTIDTASVPHDTTYTWTPGGCDVPAKP